MDDRKKRGVVKLSLLRKFMRKCALLNLVSAHFKDTGQLEKKTMLRCYPLQLNNSGKSLPWLELNDFNSDNKND
jgi:hypothetical protein